MDWHVRRATMEDYEALCELWAEGDALHVDAVPSVFRRARGPARTREYVARVLGDDSAALFVADRAGQVLGLLAIVLRSAADYAILVPRTWAAVEDVVVRQDARRRGVGRSLLEAAQRWAGDHGASAVELNVWEFNAGARAFYEKLGYRTLSRRMSLTLD